MMNLDRIATLTNKIQTTTSELDTNRGRLDFAIERSNELMEELWDIRANLKEFKVNYNDIDVSLREVIDKCREENANQEVFDLVFLYYSKESLLSRYKEDVKQYEQKVRECKRECSDYLQELNKIINW